MDRISLYRRNASAEAVGEKDGVSEKELKLLSPLVKSLTKQFSDDRKAGKLRYRDLPYDEEMVDSIHREVEHFRDRCDVLIVLGGCGSVSGNVALQQALNPFTYNLMSDRTRAGPQLFVIDSADPDQLKAVVDLITPKIKKTVVNVISKSGETLETAAHFILFRDLLQQKLGRKYKENVLATTHPRDGVLHEIAAAEGFRTLSVPEGVPGRFSVLSAVGLFSAAVCGIEIDAILAGAADMDERVKSPDLFANPAAMIAAISFLLGRKGRTISMLMPYSRSLAGLAEWYRQLWSESLVREDSPKQRDIFAGVTPVSAPGPNDENSELDLYRQGPKDKLITFLEVERYGQKVAIPQAYKDLPGLGYLPGSTFQDVMHAQKTATEFALLESQRPTLTVTLPHLSPQTIGQFLYLYGVASSYLGGLMELTPANARSAQPGTDAAFAIMGREGYGDLRSRIQATATRDKKFVI